MKTYLLVALLVLVSASARAETLPTAEIGNIPYGCGSVKERPCEGWMFKYGPWVDNNTGRPHKWNSIPVLKTEAKTLDEALTIANKRALEQ